MKHCRLVLAAPVLALLLLCDSLAADPAEGSVVTISPDLVLIVDGERVFPIGFTMPPPPDGRAPNGKNAIEELRDAGATFLRTGVVGQPWDEAALEQQVKWLDAAAQHGLHCWVYLRELGSLGPNETRKEALLRQVVSRLQGHPGMGVWKGVDEPQWGQQPIEPLVRAYRLIKELDPHHPVAVTHAPRGTVEELQAYTVTADITGADIYPIGYPPGAHSLDANREISMVGDYTRKMKAVAGDRMPVWMILQICWSGVARPGKTLRFPTFPEERFMTYQAIINGARGLIYFGGHVERGWSPEDAALGWNWRFWNRVLRPVIEEIGAHSQLYPALLAPDSRMPVQVTGADDVESCVREVGEDLFLLACKREGATVQVQFSGLAAADGEAEVMFEPPRTAQVKAGAFSDWFAPFEVHVYRLKRGQG